MRAFELQVAEMAAEGGLVRLDCAGPAPGTVPGQFCLAWSPTTPEAGGALLRTPLFPLEAGEQGAAFYVPPTHAYARLQPGDRLDVLGPCGRGFRLPHGAAHLLVIASALERLLPAIRHALANGLAVTALTPRSANLLPADVEIHRGPVTAELAAWADVVLLDVADPHARARHLRQLAPGRGEAYVQALLVPVTPCGTGACQACWVQLAPTRPAQLACVDGPVFFL